MDTMTNGSFIDRSFFLLLKLRTLYRHCEDAKNRKEKVVSISIAKI